MAMPEMEAVKDAALKYDKPTLARLAQSGQLSPTLAVMAGMMRDRVVQSEMKPPSPPTVAEEVMQPMGQRMGLGAIAPGGQPQAPQQMPPQMPQQPQPQGQGLDQVPVPPQMFERQGMASGGIVAFQAGGGTPPPSFANMYSGLTPDLEALAEARRAYMGDFPTESEEERRNRRREEQALRLMEAGLGIAGGTSESFAANLKGALPAIRGYGTDLATQRKEDFLRLAAERGEKGKVFEGVLGARGKAAEAAAAESRLDKELTSRQTVAAEDRKAREAIESANRQSRETIASLPKEKEQAAQTIFDEAAAAGMPISMEQAFTRATAALNPVADRYNALSNRLVAANKEIAALQSINEYALLGEKDPKKIEKLKTDFEEKRKNILRYYYLNEANLKELNDPGSSLSGTQPPAQPGAAPAGAQGKPLPPPEAVSMLKDNPSALAKQQFDDAFGPGAAARALASK
jgi:hypothetical protein